jgi:hypothetical protein
MLDFSFYSKINEEKNAKHEESLDVIKVIFNLNKRVLKARFKNSNNDVLFS